MMQSQKSDFELAQRFQQICEQKKALEKEHGQLREYFINRMDQMGVNALTIGNISMSITEKSRQDLDKKSLIAALGEKVISRFIKTTTYCQLNVEKVASAISKAA